MYIFLLKKNKKILTGITISVFKKLKIPLGIFFSSFFHFHIIFSLDDATASN